jgi:hypothetical protein
MSNHDLRQRTKIDHKALHLSQGIKQKFKSVRKLARAVVIRLAPGRFSSSSTPSTSTLTLPPQLSSTQNTQLPQCQTLLLAWRIQNSLNLKNFNSVSGSSANTLPQLTTSMSGSLSISQTFFCFNQKLLTLTTNLATYSGYLPERNQISRNQRRNQEIKLVDISADCITDFLTSFLDAPYQKEACKEFQCNIVTFDIAMAGLTRTTYNSVQFQKWKKLKICTFSNFNNSHMKHIAKKVNKIGGQHYVRGQGSPSQNHQLLVKESHIHSCHF